jgi:hypothetical protein
MKVLLREKSNLQGPFPNEVAADLTMRKLQEERLFKQESYDDDVARWLRILLGKYWFHVSRQRACHLGGHRRYRKDDEVCDVLKISYCILCAGLLKLMKAYPPQFKYREATGYADKAVC